VTRGEILAILVMMLVIRYVIWNEFQRGPFEYDDNYGISAEFVAPTPTPWDNDTRERERR